MAATMLVASTVTVFVATVLLITLFRVETASAELSITTAIFPLSSDGSPNTFIAPSDAVGISLLGKGVPTMLFTVVQATDVTALCQQIVNQGLLTFTLSVTDSTMGDTHDLTVTVHSTGGCMAAPDESGTEFVGSDDQGRTSALVCPQNAGSYGCALYQYADALTQAYNAFMSGRQGGNDRRLLSTTTRRELRECPAGILFGGVVVGGYAGWRLSSGCFAVIEFPPAAAFCMMVAFYYTVVTTVYSVCGAYEYYCFPGDAMLQLAGGGSKSMAKLDLGDKVAVWKPDGSLGYEEKYAFGHRNFVTTSRFYKIMMNSSIGLETSLELSDRYFAPILSLGTGGEKMVYAQEIQIV